MELCGFCFLLFPGCAGSSAAAATHARTDEWGGSGASLATSVFGAELVCLQKWLACAELPGEWRCAGRLGGGKTLCISSSPSDKPLLAVFILVSPGQLSHSASAASLSMAYYG